MFKFEERLSELNNRIEKLESTIKSGQRYNGLTHSVNSTVLKRRMLPDKVKETLEDFGLNENSVFDVFINGNFLYRAANILDVIDLAKSAPLLSISYKKYEGVFIEILDAERVQFFKEENQNKCKAITDLEIRIKEKDRLLAEMMLRGTGYRSMRFLAMDDVTDPEHCLIFDTNNNTFDRYTIKKRNLRDLTVSVCDIKGRQKWVNIEDVYIR